MLKRLELTFEEIKELKEFADEKGITFLSTPFDLGSVKVLERIGVPAFKIGSGDLTNILLLKYVALRKRPILLSTGMASMDDIQLALSTIRSTGNNQIAIMHCTSEYPVSLSDCNLRAIGTLKQVFRVPVGYSDHTMGTGTPALAVAAGACFIEKHLTLGHKMKGPDHKASLEPNEFSEMVQEIRRAEEVLGSPLKEPTDGERKMRKYVRKSIVSATSIEKGKTINDSMLTVKRPGTGIEPRYLPELIGMISRRKIQKDVLISWDMVDEKTKTK
jgi:sialic acid synthase SpsE